MKLSVCVVTYNHEPFIRQCIESAANQAVSFNYEIVVGEDHSPDGTLAILKDLLLQFPDKIRLKERPYNFGAELNFNQTISECLGEYVAFLEGDNFWTDEDKLQKQVDFLDANPDVAFCFHQTPYIDITGERTGVILPPENPPAITDISFLLHEYNPVPLGSMVVRRSLLDDLADWVSGLKLGDWPLCFMLASRGNIGFIAEEMSVQRVHKGGSWQLLPPLVQGLYILQMLNTISPRLKFPEKQILEKRAKDFTTWISTQLLSSDIETINSTFQKIESFSGNAELLAILKENTLTAKLQYLEIDAEKNKLISEKDDLICSLAEYEHHLFRAHKRPFKIFIDLILYHALEFLRLQNAVFSEKQITKLARSSAKRAPDRYRKYSKD
ncbi:glycosyltransferase family 2 protein [Agrobacterium tumefaciens]|uniref:glycosyltransferase family 2 protein n=1 Tax=Agrobacterium tumefaciens TaxID=358 RepID=UPI001574C76D|nr:glycosyltransferase family 2 protein [Agrobacterium tumefaciens]